MVQAQALDDIRVDVGGSVSGQMAVGSHITQIGSFHGILVNRASAQEPSVRPRPLPIALRPRPMRGFLDRESEVNTIHTACQREPPVNVHGTAGAGKSSLLRHLSHHLPASTFPDGVVHLSARHALLSDLLQSLFDAFFESDVPFKPSTAQIRQALRDKRAFVLLDDVELAREDVEALLDAAPACTFILTSEERCVWGEGRILALGGLPPDAALTLVERELGRPLTSQERTALPTLHADLKGHPLRLIQTTALAREEGRGLEQIAQDLHTRSPPHALVNRQLRTLSEPQNRVLAALAALNGAPLSAEQVSALTSLADPQPTLDALLRQGFVQTHSPTYSLGGDLGDMLTQIWDLTPWAEKALAYFTAWAEANPLGSRVSDRDIPARLSEATDALMQITAWAAGAQRWSDVLRLARAMDGGLTLNKQWGAWGQILQWALAAAQASGDRATQAWALHQIGSRALCLSDANAAGAALTQALELRESLGDAPGSAVTRHNLDQLNLPPPTPPQTPQPTPRSTGLPWVAKLAIGAGALGVVSLILVILIVYLPGTATIHVDNTRGCEELRPDWAPWLSAIPGVDLFDTLDVGDTYDVRVPALLLIGSKIELKRSRGETIVTLKTRAGDAPFELPSSEVEIRLDGELLQSGTQDVPNASEHELTIECP